MREYLNDLGATWGRINGMDMVVHFADEEPMFIRQQGVAYRGERGSVVGMGDDLISLLQGLVSGDVFTLAEDGSGMRTGALNINGRLVFDVRFLHIQDLLLLDFEPGVLKEGLLFHFKKNIINEDVKFIDRSEGVVKIALFGSEVVKTIPSLKNLDQLKPFHGKMIAFEGEEIIVQRIDFGRVPAFEIMLSKELGTIFFEKAISAGCKPVGEEAQEILRMEEGVPRFSLDPKATLYGSELSGDTIPLEADLHDWISFTKGCYLGQEIIARLDSRGEAAKKLRRLHIDRPMEIGASLYQKGKKIGSIAAIAPRSEGSGSQYQVSVYLKRKHNTLGDHISLETDGPETTEILAF